MNRGNIYHASRLNFGHTRHPPDPPRELFGINSATRRKSRMLCQRKSPDNILGKRAALQNLNLSVYKRIITSIYVYHRTTLDLFGLGYIHLDSSRCTVERDLFADTVDHNQHHESENSYDNPDALKQ